MRLKGRAGARTSSGTPSTRYVSMVPSAVGRLSVRFICVSVFGHKQTTVDADGLSNAVGQAAGRERAHGGRHFLRSAPALDRCEALLHLNVVACPGWRSHLRVNEAGLYLVDAYAMLREAQREQRVCH